jgi:hypothetical protein
MYLFKEFIDVKNPQLTPLQALYLLGKAWIEGLGWPV